MVAKWEASSKADVFDASLWNRQGRAGCDALVRTYGHLGWEELMALLLILVVLVVLLLLRLLLRLLLLLRMRPMLR